MSPDPSVQSWGRFPRASQCSQWQRWRNDPLAIPERGSLLPYGLGRSYGDSCLNDGNHVLRTRLLNHFISFDENSGILRAEAGVSLSEIIALTLPRGWFLPVTPGTRFVTLGGAIANDIHGKNHHQAGNFGNFVNGFELLRSDGSRRWCSREEDADLFRATVGGLGLTGLITWAELRMKPVRNHWIRCESIRYGSLDDFVSLSLESESRFEYLVAWTDCLAKGPSAGRGILMRGRHNEDLPAGPAVTVPGPVFSCPVDFPEFALNRFTVKAFNELYFRKAGSRPRTADVSLFPFFYPLDAIGEWNRIYGRRGFLQWQCLVPLESGATDAFREIFRLIAMQGSASFLAVMKTMGDAPPFGNLSFTGRGITLTLDFPIGGSVFPMLDELDRIVVAARGALYPAKDSRMKPEVFQCIYPQWRDHERWIDPAFSSSFWRRVTAKP